jgi:glutamine amidotransferase-like uncharacterized protein
VFRRLLLGFLAVLLMACRTPDATNSTPAVLLFAGGGTSPNDVAALERLLSSNSFSYALVDTARVNAMTESQLNAFRLLLIPGGNFEEIGNGLTPSATAHLRAAVRGGVSYLGICAGAFFAGNSPYNGLNLTSGVRFPFYADEDRGIRRAALSVTAAGSAPLDHYWEDGPQLSGWGDVVAKYPDGTPAVVEGVFGQGWVILSGVHPEHRKTGGMA